MNKQTRSYNKGTPYSRKVQKGQQHPDNAHSGYAVDVEKPSSKGRSVNSSKERADAGRKPWKGHGDVLGRNRK